MVRPYTFTCAGCGVRKTFELEEADVRRWKAGELIQNVFPNVEDREIMISSTCSDCFNDLFAEDEEE